MAITLMADLTESANLWTKIPNIRCKSTR